MEDEAKVKLVHRSLLKAQVQGSFAPGPSAGPSVDSEQPVGKSKGGPLVGAESNAEACVDEVDLWVVLPELQVGDASVPVEKPTSGVGRCDGLDGAIHLDNVEVSLGLPPDPSFGDLPQEKEAALWRSRRPTSGQHSNVNYLPRTVGEAVFDFGTPTGVVSNSVMALFRPWDWLLVFGDLSSQRRYIMWGWNVARWYNLIAIG